MLISVGPDHAFGRRRARRLRTRQWSGPVPDQREIEKIYLEAPENRLTIAINTTNFRDSHDTFLNMQSLKV
jgi:hypothetical protein